MINNITIVEDVKKAMKNLEWLVEMSEREE